MQFAKGTHIRLSLSYNITSTPNILLTGDCISLRNGSHPKKNFVLEGWKASGGLSGLAAPRSGAETILLTAVGHPGAFSAVII
jgi:hypothetical protein